MAALSPHSETRTADRALPRVDGIRVRPVRGAAMRTREMGDPVTAIGA